MRHHRSADIATWLYLDGIHEDSGVAAVKNTKDAIHYNNPMVEQ